MARAIMPSGFGRVSRDVAGAAANDAGRRWMTPAFISTAPDDYDAAVRPSAVDAQASTQATIRHPPAPLHGGPLTLLRFAREHGMLKPSYVGLVLRWVWL